MAASLDNEKTTKSSRFQNASNRPMMLKDFLRDDHYHHSCASSSSSSSSNGFQNYPRTKPCSKSTVRFSSKSNKPPAIVLLRSWSKKAAATKISAIHKVINVVKLLQFVKSPLILPKCNSRKLHNSKGKNDISGDHVIMPEGKVKVKVKDILRLRSFRDIAEDDPTPLDFISSPNRTATTSTSSCSKRSSWCDSDFTAEDLPFCGGENEELVGEKCFLGTNATLLRNPKGNWSIEECDQQSPVSVLHSPFREVEEYFISPYHPTLANVEKTKSILTRRIQDTKSKHARKLSFGGEIIISERVNAIEEKAKQLLSHIKEDNQSQQANDLILDFFMHELSTYGKLHDLMFHDEILRVAKSWINGKCDDESYEWEVESKREAYVNDMEKGVSWSKFKHEQEEMCIEFEVMVLNELIDEVLFDFLF